jgi:hypothetical protein
VASPVLRVYDYGPITISTSSYYVTCCGKLDEMKNQVYCCDIYFGDNFVFLQLGFTCFYFSVIRAVHINI